MPFKSQAQRAKFAEMVKEGKMSQSTFDEWNKATGDAKLPDRITPQKFKQTKVKTAKVIK